MKQIKDLNRFVIMFILMIEQILGVLELEKISSKIAPYYSAFAFGILIYFFGFSQVFFIFLIISVLMSVISIFLRDDGNNLDIIKLVSNKGEDLELAKKIGKQSAKGFIFRGILAFATFVMFVISFIFIQIYFFKDYKNITIIIFLILGLFILIYSLFFTLVKSKRIIRTPKIIKSTTNLN